MDREKERGGEGCNRAGVSVVARLAELQANEDEGEDGNCVGVVGFCGSKKKKTVRGQKLAEKKIQATNRSTRAAGTGGVQDEHIGISAQCAHGSVQRAVMLALPPQTLLPARKTKTRFHLALYSQLRDAARTRNTLSPLEQEMFVVLQLVAYAGCLLAFVFATLSLGETDNACNGIGVRGVADPGTEPASLEEGTSLWSAALTHALLQLVEEYTVATRKVIKHLTVGGECTPPGTYWAGPSRREAVRTPSDQKDRRIRRSQSVQPTGSKLRAPSGCKDVALRLCTCPFIDAQLANTITCLIAKALRAFILALQGITGAQRDLTSANQSTMCVYSRSPGHHKVGRGGRGPQRMTAVTPHTTNQTRPLSRFHTTEFRGGPEQRS
ncbi:MAG: hypothetical protein BJ554DRAFT_4816 [Olpidium bornovanus]|uniref:Uncharacterized protein n=1 Tax=Olpidium bornovanus TaxID=278681 RepID=A0A8H7ZLK0_9FUNG|nr:MAG: hypothetical protein BJ554DRAFT_4816 [Olpidium bornovanus]